MNQLVMLLATVPATQLCWSRPPLAPVLYATTAWGGSDCSGPSCRAGHRGCLKRCFGAFFNCISHGAFDSWHLEPRFEGPCNDLWYVSPPAHHGYYYFRPYNYRHIAAYSQDAAAMGNDPQMPFANELFRQRYRRVPEAQPDSNTAPEPLPMQPSPVRPRRTRHPAQLSPMAF